MRPEQLIGVTATGTDAGKTWAAARLAKAARNLGMRVSTRKPAQSFDPASTHPTDADVLGAATNQSPHSVCASHRWYPLPLAPPMAATALSMPSFTIADLARELNWPDRCQLGIVEGAGGVRSPLAADGDTRTFFDAIQPDLVVIVADTALGTINNIRLAIDSLTAHDTIVFLNRYDHADETCRLNYQWLTTTDRFNVVLEITDLLPTIQRKIDGG